jgi:putative salt-induced outer membrane protein YdiY
MTGIGRTLWSGMLIAVTLSCTLPGRAMAEKTDVVHLRNGDRITCEIKKLERGQLKVSTDGMGTIYIEWEDIGRIVSKQTYVIELQDGERIEGTLTTPTDDGLLMVSQEAGTRGLEMAGIVWIDPLKLGESRIKRWDGSVSVGFDKTKANDDTSISASFDARRRAEDFQLDYDGSLYSRSQEGTEDTLRATFGGQYRGLLEDRWYWAGLGRLERNDEQGVDLRSLAGAGYGRFLLQTGSSLWSATAGLVVVNEQRAGSEDGETNLEALLDMEYEFFTYDTPKTRLKTGLTVYPSLTESGRVRTDADISLSRELIEDLFVELSFYDSWDSKPPVEGEKNDYGIVTSLGYSF